MEFNFEWDPDKARANLNKHRISFEEAATVFGDRNHISAFDSDHSEDEDRWVTLGFSKQGRLLVVSHTFREKSRKKVVAIRIISSRKATKSEETQYGA